MTFIVRDTSRDNEKTVDTLPEAKEKQDDMVSLGARPEDIVIEEQSDTESTETADVEIVDETEPEQPEPEDISPKAETAAEKLPGETAAESDEITLAAISRNPIDELRRHNDEFVNVVKGTPAISKRGFRFLQSALGIETQSEIVQKFNDPVGVVIWAKAELPNGRSAEAHGEGYINERDVDDNEFVRYADTRAKNRAISDLTSAGALAASELKE